MECSNLGQMLTIASSIIHSFHKHLLSTYYVLGNVLSTVDTKLSKTDKNSALRKVKLQ